MSNDLNLPVPGVTPVIPPVGLRPCIDNEDVRHFLFDRVALDNQLLLDLEFSDKEINQAQRLACMDYNDMQPPVEFINPGAITQGLGMIVLYGIASYLHQGKLMQLQRNNLEYTAGGMEVDINAKRIAALTLTAKDFKEQFYQKALDRKRTLNIAAAYGSSRPVWY